MIRIINYNYEKILGPNCYGLVLLFERLKQLNKKATPYFVYYCHCQILTLNNNNLLFYVVGNFK